MKLSGVFIAPLTPLTAEGRIDFESFHQLLEYLLDSRPDGICIGGGTSEYPHFDLDERKKLIRRAAEQVRDQVRLLVSIGSSSFHRALELGHYARNRKVDALLIPMPHFYTYSQQDLEHFCRQMSRALETPSLLYNLPAFTNPLASETAIRLLRTEPGLIGIKDSSGDRTALSKFVEAVSGENVSLIIGEDMLLYDALAAGWDGVVSGLGNLCPELLVRLFHAFQTGNHDAARLFCAELNRINSKLSRFPVPWAIRAGLEVRGIRSGSHALPLTPNRAEELESFKKWYSAWLENDLPSVLNSSLIPDGGPSESPRL